MFDLELHGLSQRQYVLADIMWRLENFSDVENFIATLPRDEAQECRGIIEMMKLAIFEQEQDDSLELAQKLIQRVK